MAQRDEHLLERGRFLQRSQWSHRRHDDARDVLLWSARLASCRAWWRGRARIMHRLRLVLCAATLAVGFTACAGGSSADGSTSWLSVCKKDSDCRRGLSCLCAVCTRTCETSRSCTSLGDGAACGSSRELGGDCSA